MTIFITGIDTDAGKSYAVGHLARCLASEGKSVMTMKFIQTGNTAMSEDILVHRRVMGIPLQDCDLDGTTAPVIFTYPCSPQLAARIDGREIDLEAIDLSADKLNSRYDVVLIEGAGGPMVPVTDDFLTIDYPTTRHMAVALVSNGRLGSISHTLLGLEAIKSRGLELSHFIYNCHFDADAVIVEDTRAFLQRYLKRHFPEAQWIDVPSIV